LDFYYSLFGENSSAVIIIAPMDDSYTRSQPQHRKNERAYGTGTPTNHDRGRILSAGKERT
jgi:hypothetical protein